MVRNYKTRTLDVPIDSNLLGDVIRLWRRNSETLGFLPEGAFYEYAKNKGIIVACDERGKLSGYILFRIAKQVVTIAHLCIHNEHKGQGLTRLLLNDLRETTKDQKGIGLHCRRDYAVSGLWPKLGFIAASEKPGRGANRETLTYWWLSYRAPDLLSVAEQYSPQNQVVVAIDANVFYDLDPANSTQQGIESKALESDWFAEHAKIILTEEIFNEISRNPDSEERNKHRNRAHSIGYLEPDKKAVESLQDSLESLLGKPKKEQQYSDIRQLANAIAANAGYFVTRDDFILKRDDDIYESHGIYVRRPVEILLEVDYLRDEISFHPKRLAGSDLKLTKLRSDDIAHTSKSFFLQEAGESSRLLEKHLSQIASQIDNTTVYLMKDGDGAPLAVYATEMLGNGVCRIVLARVKMGYLENTLARYVTHRILLEAVKNNVWLLVFMDQSQQQCFGDALISEGYIRHADSYWLRIVVSGIYQFDHIREKLRQLIYATPESSDVKKLLSDTLLGALNDELNQDKFSIFELETALWPCKIAGVSIPCFVVPIRKEWAMELFDDTLADEDLFGATAELAIQREGVYYYSAKGGAARAPARILWYVSNDPRSANTKSIRACSILLDVSCERPKSLFKRYQRLGVYKWRDVFRTAEEDINNNVRALHFGYTEVFPKGVPLNAVKELLRSESVNTSFPSVTPISSSAFLRIYEAGVQYNG